MANLRIVFVCPPEGFSGGERVISIYARKLAQRGHKVTVVIPRHRLPSIRARARNLLKHGKWLSRPRRELSHFSNSDYDVIRLAHMAPVTDRDVPDADIVIATWWETAEWVWALSDKKGKKIQFLQDYETWGAPNGDISRVDSTIGLPMPKIVIAQWVQDLLVRYFNQTPLAFILNSVDTEQFRSVPRGKQKVITVGFTYSSLWNKGCDVTEAAIRRARLYFPELRVVAFGSERPTEFPLPPRTDYNFRIADNELPRLYSSCDAWLFGTRIEGFGLPILEAMACRTPVIGTPAGAAPNLISKGGGILVPMEDVGAMSDAIVRIAKMSDSQWRAMSDAAYNTSASYSWDDATDLFEAAVKSVAG
jgi:glycosyltransferase involved in cell wall biosynthesis